MPVLPCPLGVRCHDGEDGGTWKTVDIPFEQAMMLVDKHVQCSHQSDGAPGDRLNVNKGNQGGNFDNCDLQNPIFNINSPYNKSIKKSDLQAKDRLEKLGL